MDISENLVSLPGGEILFARLASNLMQSGEIDEAKKLCERGLKKYPAYAQAHYILAKCYLRMNMSDEARAELERVLRYDANHIKAVRDLAGICLAGDRQDMYKEYLFKLYTLDPLNGAVIEEIKKSGLDEMIGEKPEQKTSEGAANIPSSTEIESKEKEELFIAEEGEKPAEGDPLFPDRLDLSQFDNLKDDFTTILHGNLESPAVLTPSGNGEVNQELSPANGIFAMIPEEEGKTKANIIEEHHEAVNQSSNKGTELSVEESEILKESDSIKTVSDLDQVEDELDRDLTEIDEIEADDQSSVDQNQLSENKNEAVESTSQESDLDTTDLQEDEDKFEQPKIISQTLGEILVSQKKYVEAKAVFEALKEKQPENKSLDTKIEFLDKIIGLEKK